MGSDRVEVGEETGAKKAFAWAIDWPGWCRSGRDASLARAALVTYLPRYMDVATAAGLTLPAATSDDLEIVESVGGGSGTDFGVPSAITDRDRRPADADRADRLSRLVEAAWSMFDAVAASAPPVLRKGPRGGGRDRDKMIDHVIGADHAYAREISVRLPAGSLTDRAAVEAERAAVIDVLRRPSDGSPLADRTWPLRYAARRIAWHALDHAWEMEDRAESGS